MNDSISKLEQKLANVVAMLNQGSQWQTLPDVVMLAFIEVTSVLREQSNAIRLIGNKIDQLASLKGDHLKRTVSNFSSCNLVASKSVIENSRMKDYKMNEPLLESKLRVNDVHKIGPVSTPRSMNSPFENLVRQSSSSLKLQGVRTSSPIRLTRSESFNKATVKHNVIKASASCSEANLITRSGRNTSFDSQTSNDISQVKSPKVTEKYSPQRVERRMKKTGSILLTTPESEKRRRNNWTVKFAEEDDVIEYTVNDEEFNVEFTNDDSDRKKKLKSKINLHRGVVGLLENSAEHYPNFGMPKRGSSSELKVYDAFKESNSDEKLQREQMSKDEQIRKILEECEKSALSEEAEDRPREANVSSRIIGDTLDAHYPEKLFKVPTSQRLFQIFTRRRKFSKSKIIIDQSNCSDSEDMEISPDLAALIRILAET